MRSTITRISIGSRRILATVGAAFLLAIPAIAQPLSGSYTVCSSGCSYSSVNAAASDLNSKGVSGPVVINISAANYQENVTINNVSGASATNTITFKGASRWTTRIFNTSGTTGILYLNTAKWIIIRDLTIEHTGTSGTRYAVRQNTTDNIRYVNAVIKAPILTTFSSSVHALSNNFGKNTKVINSSIIGGYYGYFNNQSSSSYIYGGDSIRNSRITNAYYYAMYNNGGSGNVYDGNYIDSAVYQYAYLVYSQYEGRPTYMRNTIPMFNAYMGIYFYSPNYWNTALAPARAFNNILGGGSSFSYYGFYIYSYFGGARDIDHNTINITGNQGGYNISATNYYSGAMRIRNNNLTRTQSGFPINYYSTSYSTDVLEGNNYFSTTGEVAYYNYTSYTSLADYKAAAGQNGQGQTDQNVSVTYKSATDFHFDQTKPAPYGRGIGITTDIDGDNRCLVFPTAGADENNFGKNSAVVKIFPPATVYENNPIVIRSNFALGEPRKYTWFVNNVKVGSDSPALNITLASTSTVKLVAEGCAGKDSGSTTVTVVVPTAVPRVAFISNINSLLQGGTVKFFDLSTNGPTSWKWSVSPDSTFDGGSKVATIRYLQGTSATSQNPIIRFDYPGNYNICLVSTNRVGNGTQVCKNAYIEVIPSINMCSQSVTRSPKGFLFDDGGPNGSTTAQSQCGLLIDPCADSVYFMLTDLDVYCGYDYLRVYDGKDATGTLLGACQSNNSYFDNLPGFTQGLYSCQQECVPYTSTGSDTLRAGRQMFIDYAVSGYAAYSNLRGFAGEWWSKSRTSTAPTASFTGLDSVCTNAVFQLKNTTQGDEVTYLYDVDGDYSFFEFDGQDLQYVFGYAGTYTITLVATNCGGTDTFTKNIVVSDPPRPRVAFTVDNTNPGSGEVVQFTSTIPQCVDDFSYFIRKANGSTTGIAYASGSTRRSENPRVTFTDTGCYTVSLKATNATGVDSLVKTCMVRVKQAACVPIVATLVPDLGISRVQINTINNSSSQGTRAYTDYRSTQGTTLDIGATYSLVVDRTSNRNAATRSAFIDWNADNDFDDQGERITLDSNSTALSVSKSISVPNYAVLNATVLRIAINEGTYGNLACGANEFGEYEDYRIFISNDKTVPVITRRGADTIRIEQGSVFTDSGATALDNLDGNITNNIVVNQGGFNVLVPSTYIFTFNVKDNAGNSALTVRRVVIVTPDATNPVLTLRGDSIMTVAVGTNFIDPGIQTANDGVDGDVSASLVRTFSPNDANGNVVDTTYTFYTVTDRLGNSTTVRRTIIVYDSIRPVVTLNGTPTIFVEAGDRFVDPMGTATDNYYTGLTVERGGDAIDSLATGETTTLGSYTLTYTTVDGSGNNAQTVTRTVVVRDTKAPVVTMNGNPGTTFLEVNEGVYTDAGVTAMDGFDKENVTVTRGGTFFTQFANGIPNRIGTFTVTYTVVDRTGNSVVVTRNITVRDTKAPVIRLNGAQTFTVERWSDLDAAINAANRGYTVIDNYDAAASILVELEFTSEDTTTTLDNRLITYRYKATDASGNVGYSDLRFVNVGPRLNTSVADGLEGTSVQAKLYPNPAAGVATLELTGVTQGTPVRVVVYNMLGAEVGQIVNGTLPSDKIALDLTNQPAGMYLVRIQANGGERTLRMEIAR